MPQSAKVILNSVAPNGVKLISVEVRFWRSILAELNTHRNTAKNAASSRAIPFYRQSKEPEVADPWIITDTPYYPPVPNCTYSYIKDDPFIPEFIGAEQKSMQSGDELEGEDRKKAISLIHEMREFNLQKCKEMYDLGVHKSIINRYVEPWMYTTVLITATEWKNLFRLRIHPSAEKHFCQMATMIRDALRYSTSTYVEYGQWHLPYVHSDEYAEIDKFASGLSHRDMASAQLTPGDTGIVKCAISSARCARLSYLTQDGRRDLEEDWKLFNRLINPTTPTGDPDDAIHASPTEHVGRPLHTAKDTSGPFRGWGQFRKLFANENLPG
jgi:hypothetical protein